MTRLEDALKAALTEVESEFVPPGLVNTDHGQAMLAMFAHKIVTFPAVAEIRDHGIAIKQAAMDLVNSESPTPEQWDALRKALGM